MCTYLAKRQSTYYFRRAIPAELRPTFDGRAEFMWSLRTKDRAEAKRLIPAETLATDKLLDAASAKLRTPVEPVPDASPWDPWRGMTQDEFEAQLEHRAQETQLSIREDEAWLAAQEWEANLPHGHRATLLLRDARRQRDEYRDRYVRRKDRDSRKGGAISTAPAPASSHGTLLTADEDTTDIVDLWAAERKVQPKGVDTHRAVARWFYERAGTKAVDQIIRKDVLTFKSKLLEEGQSAANIKMKLSRLRTLLQWAFVNDFAPLNAAQGIEIKDTEGAKNKRRPFDLPALNAIFASPIYSEGERPTQGRGEAGYWLPLLALFTGARMEELGQLRPDDVQWRTYPDANGKEQAAWFLHLIEAEGEDGTNLKNAASERLVPVHSELVWLGFITFAQAMKLQGNPRLFHMLKPNKYGFLTAKWGEWWSGYRRNVCGITDGRMVFHSFRHTFKDYARHAGIPEGVQRQIMGHSSDDVADDYGSGYSLHRVVEGMKLYMVPGLKLPGPIVEAAGAGGAT